MLYLFVVVVVFVSKNPSLTPGLEGLRLQERDPLNTEEGKEE